MQSGEDLSNIVARVAGEVAVEVVRTGKEVGLEVVKTGKDITMGISKQLLEVLLRKMLEKDPFLKPGKTNLIKLMKSNNDLKMTDVKQEDIKNFARKAKKFGLAFAVIKEKNTKHVIYKAEDIERAKEIFKLTLAEKMRNKEVLKQNEAKGKVDIEKNKQPKKESIRVKLEKIEKSKEQIELEKVAVNTINKMKMEKTNVQKSYVGTIKVNSESNKKMKIEAKLLKEQQVQEKRDMDVSNDSISVKSHNEKNKVNKTVKLIKENKDKKESIKGKLQRISQTRNTVSKSIKKPAIQRGR